VTVEAGNDELVGTGGDVPDVGEEVACVAGYWCEGECLSGRQDIQQCLARNGRNLGKMPKNYDGECDLEGFITNHLLPVQTMSVTAPLSSQPLKVLCINPSK